MFESVLRRKSSPSPRTSLLAAGIWIMSSVIFLDISYARVSDMRAAGRSVSPWRLAEVGLWLVMLAVWLWLGWQAWRRYRSERTVV